MAIAYSLIRKGGEVTQQATPFGQPATVKYDEVKLGDSVSQDDLGVTDEMWASYYRDSVVGDEPLPEDMESNETMTQYRIRKATEQLNQATQQGDEPLEVPMALRETYVAPIPPDQVQSEEQNQKETK